MRYFAGERSSRVRLGTRTSKKPSAGRVAGFGFGTSLESPKRESLGRLVRRPLNCRGKWARFQSPGGVHGRESAVVDQFARTRFVGREGHMSGYATIRPSESGQHLQSCEVRVLPSSTHAFASSDYFFLFLNFGNQFFCADAFRIRRQYSERLCSLRPKRNFRSCRG